MINDIQHRPSVVENDLKWIKWLLRLEIPLFIGSVIGVVKLVIG
ncbi:MAG: hypothetical protein ACUVTD_05085 [Nitrososphaerales archaeon]